MQARGVEGDPEVEENTNLLNALDDRRVNPSVSKGDRVRRRLSLCLFLHIAGVAIVTQVYPRVVLDFFNNDDGKASKFNGWLTLISSVVQLIAIPTLCGASDVVGRRAILGGSLALTSVSALALGLAPSSILAVSVCQVVSGVAGAILPVSQAIIIDLSHWGAAAGGGEVTHGLGLIGAAFGLAISVGPILGGSLSEYHRTTGCLLSASMSLVALLSLKFFGWEETAPAVLTTTAVNTSGRRGRWRSWCMKGSKWTIVNPFSVLRVFMESSLLMQMAGVLLCFSLSLNVFCVYYNYLDFRYHWNALDISFFFSALGVLLALTSGVMIRFLVPKRLSMERGVLIGLSLQATSTTLYGLAPRGWMLYPVLLATVVQYITEPCIQGVMATLVGADRQGSLQGAVQSLRILAQGMAGVVYGQIFSFGVSERFKELVGMFIPGLPLFCSAACGLTGLVVAWCSLRKLGDSIDPKSASGSLEIFAEEGGIITAAAAAAAGLGTPLTVPATEGSGSGGDDGGGDGGRFSAGTAAPAAATESKLAELPATGLGNEDGMVSDISEPLLPRGGSTGSRESSS